MPAITPFDFRPRTRVVFGAGEFTRLGELAREFGGAKCLLVAEQAIVDAGYAQEAVRALRARRIEVFAFHEFGPNPNTAMIEAGGAYAAPHDVNLIAAVGGEASMDCAKALNFVISNGGRIQDYWGYGKASKAMIPMIAVPTTAGAGNEATASATILDLGSRKRMTCGDAKLAFRTAILDPKLTITLDAALTASAGYDALSHALESLVATRQNAFSDCYAHAAWRMLSFGFERVLANPHDLEARGAMLLGAHFGGLAVENSTLGAAHACAQPLTDSFGIPHGTAIALMLAPVVEWNRPAAGRRYDQLYPGDLPRRLRELAEKGGLPASLRDAGVPAEAISRLADDAGSQWFGKFNPRPFDSAAAREIYELAY
jgi:alcohol dehydrogenase